MVKEILKKKKIMNKEMYIKSHKSLSLRKRKNMESNERKKEKIIYSWKLR